MSYCRWSSNNWDCDLYCYEDVMGGYTTMVADNRLLGQPPRIDVKAEEGEFARQYKARREWFKTAEHVKIGLPCDGQMFTDETLEEFLERVLALRDMGYHVPDSAIEAIREDIVEVTGEA